MNCMKSVVADYLRAKKRHRPTAEPTTHERLWQQARAKKAERIALEERRQTLARQAAELLGKENA